MITCDISRSFHCDSRGISEAIHREVTGLREQVNELREIQKRLSTISKY
jgi:hypothetical protein